MSKTLSKSKYTSGLDCPRKLWLMLWRPELRPEPVGMDALIMAQGVLFGRLARQLYPDATLIDIDLRNLARAENDTHVAIESGAATILEATFRNGRHRVLSDVIQRNSDGTWHLIEVKSSTRVKAEHIPDLAYQRYVIEQCGHKVSRCSVLHANSAGKLPDLKRLFSQADVTAQVAGNLSAVEGALQTLTPLLKDGAQIPPMRFRKICTACEFKGHCWQGISGPTIYESIDIRKIAAMEARGIFYIDDIPDDFPLSDNVREMVDRMQAHRVDINQPAIAQMLEQLKYPLYFLDFESVSVAKPLFADSSPWRKYAFQFSLHVQQENGVIEHVEFLHEDNSDPGEAIARSLMTHIGETGSIIVYHKNMERGVLLELARQFPDWAVPLKSMSARLWDLELVFKKHYRHWQWANKSSIKKVLPTLVPELSYQALEVQDGGAASLGWLEMIAADDLEKKSAKAEALKRYCGLDTFAMVKLLEVVKQAVLRV